MSFDFNINNSARLTSDGAGLKVERAYKLNGIYYDVQIQDRTRNLAAGDWLADDLIRSIQGHFEIHLRTLNISRYDKMVMTADEVVVDQKSYSTETLLDANSYARAVGASEDFVRVYTPLTSRVAMNYFSERVLKIHEVAIGVLQPNSVPPSMVSVPSAVQSPPPSAVRSTPRVFIPDSDGALPTPVAHTPAHLSPASSAATTPSPRVSIPDSDDEEEVDQGADPARQAALDAERAEELRREEERQFHLYQFVLEATRVGKIALQRSRERAPNGSSN